MSENRVKVYVGVDARFKAGGARTRYTVRIGRSETYLFNEDGRWFVERRES